LENVERGLILLYFLEQREVEVLAERWQSHQGLVVGKLLAR
jgi:hypothetical protein